MTARSRNRAARPAARTVRSKRHDWRAWALGGGLALLAMGLLVGVLIKSGGSGGSSASAPGTGVALSELRTPDFHSIAISPAAPQLVLYGHHGGVLRSTDGGRTWSQTNLTGSTDDAMGMGISTSDPSLAFAAGHGTFFRSTDGGNTWTSMKPKLPGTDVHGMAVSPEQPAALYAHVVGQGLFRSDDAGDTWKKTHSQSLPADIIQVAASSGGRVYLASVGSGVLRSDDGGVTFKPTGRLQGGVLSVATAAVDSNVVYAGTDSQLFVSRDGGGTWVDRPLPKPGQVMVAGVNPRDANDVMVIAVGSDQVGRVYRSHDGGASWTS
jgi:photosystem II stability/assembly factor-like uncharacterized protein